MYFEDKISEENNTEVDIKISMIFSSYFYVMEYLFRLKICEGRSLISSSINYSGETWVLL